MMTTTTLMTVTMTVTTIMTTTMTMITTTVMSREECIAEPGSSAPSSDQLCAGVSHARYVWIGLGRSGSGTP